MDCNRPGKMERQGTAPRNGPHMERVRICITTYPVVSILCWNDVGPLVRFPVVMFMVLLMLLSAIPVLAFVQCLVLFF